MDPDEFRTLWERYAVFASKGYPLAIAQFRREDPLQSEALARKLVAAMDAGDV